MALAMAVGLSLGDIVLDGDLAPPPEKRAQPPIFGPCLLWPNRCMYQDITWYGGTVGFSLGDIVLDGDPAPLHQKRGHIFRIFGQCPLWPNGWMD